MFHKNKKSLGQNFLIDKNIIKKIIKIGNITSNDSILEIGPGTGNLTEYLIDKKPKEIFVIEKDANLISILSKKFENKLKIIEDDVLMHDQSKLSKEKLIVFGNLPYNISTQILCKWIIDINSRLWFKKLILMFQKEVADRILASPNNKNYGRISIIVKWGLEIKKEFDLNPSCFKPSPKVNSTLLSFQPKKKLFKLKDPKNLEKITRIFFSQRRKMIKNPLKQIFKDLYIINKNLNLDLNLRPENLDPNTYFLITKEFEKLIN
jgi:16S rRNA (adenine1518-N6/adenine1519-N6)-dimethyltransferase